MSRLSQTRGAAVSEPTAICPEALQDRVSSRRLLCRRLGTSRAGSAVVDASPRRRKRHAITIATTAWTATAICKGHPSRSRNTSTRIPPGRVIPASNDMIGARRCRNQIRRAARSMRPPTTPPRRSPGSGSCRAESAPASTPACPAVHEKPPTDERDQAHEPFDREQVHGRSARLTTCRACLALTAGRWSVR